jgi:uncharacterized membrane protein YfcA
VTVVSLALIGLATGLLSATLGIGGGIVFVPALVGVLGFGQHLAEGTSLLAIIPTALVGVLGHARASRVDWRLGLSLATGGVAGGLLGAAAALALPPLALRRLFAVFLVLMALRMLGRARRSAHDQPAGAD